MMTPSTKTDVVLLIERVRRAMPHNRDVMDVVDLLERAVVSTSDDVVSTRKPTVVSTPDCELCARRRIAKAKAMRRLRAKAKKPLDPMETPIVGEWQKIIGQTGNKPD